MPCGYGSDNVAFRVAPLSSDQTVTPGIAPPLASVTTPRTAAVYDDSVHPRDL